jgi:hypothetical protein
MNEMISKRFPQYMREDILQESRMCLTLKAEGIAMELKGGRIKDVMGYVYKTMLNAANDYAALQKSIDCKLVRIDDLQLEAAIYPKSYKRSKLIKKIKEALVHFYVSRYPEDGYAERASRFAYIMLEGKRPNMTTNNLQKFFNGRRIHAQLAYTTALIMIKKLLEMNGDVE